MCAVVGGYVTTGAHTHSAAYYSPGEDPNQKYQATIWYQQSQVL